MKQRKPLSLKVVNKILKPANFKTLSYKDKIEYWCRYTNVISASNKNSKTGTNCYVVSLPPDMSCRKDAECYKKGCYCRKGRQIFPNCLGSYYRNWRLWKENPERYEQMINDLLDWKPLKYFRYNDAGDIPSIEYLDMMARIAEKNPDVKFLAYTKKYDLVNQWLDIHGAFPSNLVVRFSYWSKFWFVPNPYNLPGAWVKFKKAKFNPLFPSQIFTCSCKKGQTCSECGICWNTKVHDVAFNQH